MSKHRRVCRSSSAGEIGVSRFRPIESPVACWERKRPAQGRSVQKGADVKNRKPPAVDPAREMNKDRRCEFTIGSPGDAETVSNKICAAEFLQTCFLCKKNLKAKDDLFMYGCLGAFCSPDCRDSQMALDGFEKEVSRELTKKLTAGNLKKKDMPRQCLGNQQQNQV